MANLVNSLIKPVINVYVCCYQETQNHAYHLLSNKGWQSLYNWLSPEVLNGEPPTKGGDIYSLCCVIWELCTGGWLSGRDD